MGLFRLILVLLFYSVSVTSAHSACGDARENTPRNVSLVHEFDIVGQGWKRIKLPIGETSYIKVTTKNPWSFRVVQEGGNGLYPFLCTKQFSPRNSDGKFIELFGTYTQDHDLIFQKAGQNSEYKVQLYSGYGNKYNENKKTWKYDRQSSIIVPIEVYVLKGAPLRDTYLDHLNKGLDIWLSLIHI